MNLAKSKVVLKKINTLHESIELGDGISKIEKDLFLDYIKELYEIVLEGKQKKEKKHKHLHELESKKSIHKEDKGRKIDKGEKSKRRKDQYVKEDYVADGESISELKKMEEEADISPVTAYIPNGVHKEELQNGNADMSVSTAKTINPEILNLFDKDIIDETSYRFSQAPISDITKAMGINEKILTVNLLFNKDHQDFNYVAAKLNYFNTFEEASNYLKTEVANKYEWTNEDKRSKAIDFIKLVRRKYNL